MKISGFTVCKEKFTNDKVRDHCHFTGRYRGAAHNLCNLKYRKPNFTPVVFHNLSGYIATYLQKILVLGILALLKEYKLEVIRRTEKLILYTIK